MMEKANTWSVGSARHAYLYSMVGYAILWAIINVSQRIFNKSNIPGEKIFDPVPGVIIAAVTVIGFSAITFYHLKTTDEHDRQVNLWAFSLALLTFAIVSVGWKMVSHTGLLGPVDPGNAFLIAATVGTVTWTWLKFR
jgi:heme/copper-type cytochrome/quinol oxidase subunit 4